MNERVTPETFRMVAVRGLPDGVVFLSHATRRALLVSYEALVGTIKSIDASPRQTLSVRDVEAVLEVADRIRAGDNQTCRGDELPCRHCGQKAAIP
jgi:hypothetical protein